MESIEQKFKLGRIMSKYLIADTLLYEERFHRLRFLHKLCQKSRIYLTQMFNYLNYGQEETEEKLYTIDLRFYTDEDIIKSRRHDVVLNIYGLKKLIEF